MRRPSERGWARRRLAERGSVYLPLAWPLWVMLFMLATFFLVMLFLRVLTTGFANLGFGPGVVLAILIGSFVGGAINIPIKRCYRERIEQVQLPSYFGMRYSLPMFRRVDCTLLAVNVGGCVIPVAVSVYLLARTPAIIPSALITVGLCAMATHAMARIVPGVGIALPFFAPPLISALLGILIAPQGCAAPVAYVTGSLGTLIGADLLNLHRLKTIRAPVASIGGAGTWDGIFLSGVLAAALAF